MPEHIRKSFLHDAIDGQVDGFSECLRRLRDAGFDHDVRMRFAPHLHKRAKGLAQSQFGQSSRPQPVEHPTVGSLQGLNLLEHGGPVFQQCRPVLDGLRRNA
jgi:hypothetical protein